ncbi:putative transcriptional regulator YdeE [Bacillus pakistanensis]|uniref:Transcriptional regulator YdeE n=1 Tax=Rossellomorea pakistanensis TaxID=992288 RepID=A0ABS2N737_9BACI|nr:GyrI-like domain-containing protein [Bacillus pakistanensis]MBM7583670.1 putative transcriptional regulator YdeE [Bacillus pakistanensis]
MQAKIVEKEALTAVGYCWKGTFEQAGAGEIRSLMSQFREKMNEIPYLTSKESILGLSFDVSKEGFTYYICREVHKVDELPNGMKAVSIPSLTYATYKHSVDQDIEESYSTIYKWMKEKGYAEDDKQKLTHFEIYPMKYDPMRDRPELTINIPIVTKGIKND